MELRGKYNEAKVYTNNMEESAAEQIQKLLDHPAFSGTKIRIMPDVHAGAGCVIGFTSTLNTRIVPNLIGVDIGCGVLAIRVEKVEINFASLDRFIKEKIPNGKHRNKEKVPINEELAKRISDTSMKIGIKPEEQLKGIGSLGGGNHFIEVNKSRSDEIFVTVHSGSRNFGKQVCDYHQKKAVKYCDENEYEYLTMIKILIEKIKNNKNITDIELLISHLKKLSSKFEKLGREKNRLETNVFCVLLLEIVGKQKEAETILQETLEFGESEGFYTLFADENKNLENLLSSLSKLGILKEYIKKLLASSKKETNLGNRYVIKEDNISLLIEQMSEREIEILKLISEGYSNNDICNKLYLSLSTVKWHNQNIFDKLHAKRRGDAVAKAREAGII